METQTVNDNIDFSKTAASFGIMRLGINYAFTKLNHHEIMEVLEKARIKKGLTKAKLSLLAGYTDGAYNQVARGSRFSRISFDSYCKVLKVLHHDNSMQSKIEFNPVSVEDMISHLKSLGYRIQKPVTTYEEI
jgi:transcriptional regulator with XRE-family HTH domain